MAQNADKTLNRCAETGKCQKNIIQEPPYNLLYKNQRQFFLHKYDMRESTAFRTGFSHSTDQLYRKFQLRRSSLTVRVNTVEKPS